MKKLLQWVLPAFLGIVPVLGGDEIITDPFFTKSDTAVSIRMVYESGPNVVALVDATDSTKTASLKVNAACAPDGWDMDDTARLYREKVLAQVICGTQALEKAYTKRQEFPYDPISSVQGASFVNDVLVERADLLPGVKVSLRNLQHFQRPNKTKLEVKSDIIQEAIVQILYDGKIVMAEDFLKEPEGTKATVAMFSLIDDQPATMLEELYPIIRTVATDPTFDFYYCWKHELETQAGIKNLGKKVMRHAHSRFSATPTALAIKKNTLNDSKTIFKGNTETLLTLLSQQQIGSGQKNEGQCTQHNFTTGFPNGYRVVTKL